MPKWPAGVILCDLIIDDDPSTSAGLTDLATFVTVKLILKDTERLVWADGSEFLPLPDRVPNPERISVPVSDQVGWTDGGGNSYQGFAFEVTVERIGPGANSSYTVPVQPKTGQTQIVVSRLSDGTIGSPIILPPGGRPVTTAYPQPLSNTWFVQHNLGRKPLVQLLVSGEQVFTRTVITDTTVTATFPNPTTGDLVLA